MSTLISPDDTWTLWAIVIGITALSFYIEQKYKIGAKISSVLPGSRIGNHYKGVMEWIMRWRN